MRDRIITFFSDLLSVILGIVITFTIQGMIDRASDKKEVRSALELVRTELQSNMDDIAVMTDYLRQEGRSAQYMLDHRQTIHDCPLDSLYYHTGVLFASASITTCQDALELLKMSSLFQKINNNPLSMKIIRAYDACEIITDNMNHHIALRDERFENSVTDQSVKVFASSGFIDIRDYIKTDYGLYAIRSLSSMTEPTEFTDVSDMQIAIDAIDEYLAGRRHHSRKSKVR
ncbi:MAG: hypothetical protein II851_06745 [Bacteroidales bacterium]|nr:hypothetical protein [Bacteroidales bacterium]